MEITWRVISGEGEAKNRWKVQGIRGIIGGHKIDGEVKNTMRNRESKELICTTHGHELRGGMLEGGGVQGRVGIKGRQ